MLNVGVLFDTAHYYCTPTKFDQLSIENVSLIKHVHINDMKDIPAEFCDHNRDRVLPGQGCLDLSSILNRLELHGYCGDFSIEMFSQRLWNLPTEDAAKECTRACYLFVYDFLNFTHQLKNSLTVNSIRYHKEIGLSLIHI